MDAERQSGFVVCQTVPDTEAVALAVSRLVGEGGYVITARANDVQFRLLSAVGLHTELAAWEEGRAFSEAAELRWRRLADGRFSLLLLTEQVERVPTDWEPLDAGWTVQLHQKDDENLRVWGERKVGPTSWAEARIPRFLDYPVPGETTSFRISWFEYWDGNGAPRLTRLRGIEHATS